MLLVSAVLVAATPAPGQDAREVFRALNALRVDRSRIYYVRDLHLRKDALRFTFTEGKLAFLQTFEGRITGAVFTGQARVIAVPRDGVERRSLAWFVGAPLLDQPVERVYLRFTDNTAEELLKQIRAADTRARQDAAFADDWDVVATNLNPSHSMRILIERLSADPRPYFYAGMTGQALGTFEAIVDDRREEQVLIGQPRWKEGVQSYDVWASFGRAAAGGSEPRKIKLAFVPVSFAISTLILPDLRLEGQSTLRIQARQAGERVIPLELSRHLRVQSITDAQGRTLDFFQNEALNREEIQERGNDMLLVALPEAPREGQELELRVAYQGNVISDAGNSVFFVGERGSWYPGLGWRDAFATFDLTFRWPRRLTLVATGKRTDFREEGDWRIGRWQSTAPIPMAGFNLGEYAIAKAESGALQVEVYGNKQLEDALLERFQQLTLVSIERPPGGPRSARTVVVMPQPPPSPSALLGSLAQDIADSVRFFEQYHGPFPFPSLAVSPLPAGIGQGWPGLLYLSTLTFLPPAAQQRAGLRPRTQQQLSELLPFHEVAHQWWGNSVGSGSYRDYWIHEGLASYMALLHAESKHPDKSLATWLDRFRGDLVVKQDDQEEILDEAGPLSLGPRLRSSKMAGAYERIFYGKGPWVFHMLRMMLREEAGDAVESKSGRSKSAPGRAQAAQAGDPDERFKRLLRGLLENYRQAPLTTEDLQRAVEKMMTPAMDLERNGSMEWFFDQWVRNTGIPRYSVSFDVRQQGERFLVRGKLKQSGVPETFTAAVPIYAPRGTGKPVLLGTVITDGAETNFQFTARAVPRRLLIDPNRTILCVTE
jgi:hypothetical protein